MTSSLNFELDDNDYIFVDKIQDENCFCDESFDYCDDDLSEISQSPSSLASVCSENMFIQFSFEAALEKLNDSKTAVEQDEVNASNPAISCPKEGNCVQDQNKKANLLNQKHSEDFPESPSQQPVKNKTVPSRNGSRLSNKKRRKKMKLLKKAAAKTTATIALHEMRSIPESTLELSHKKGMSKTTRKKEHKLLRKKSKASLSYVNLQ